MEPSAPPLPPPYFYSNGITALVSSPNELFSNEKISVDNKNRHQDLDFSKFDLPQKIVLSDVVGSSGTLAVTENRDRKTETVNDANFLAPRPIRQRSKSEEPFSHQTKSTAKISWNWLKFGQKKKSPDPSLINMQSISTPIICHSPTTSRSPAVSSSPKFQSERELDMVDIRVNGVSNWEKVLFITNPASLNRRAASALPAGHLNEFYANPVEKIANAFHNISSSNFYGKSSLPIGFPESTKCELKIEGNLPRDSDDGGKKGKYRIRGTVGSGNGGGSGSGNGFQLASGEWHNVTASLNSTTQLLQVSVWRLVGQETQIWNLHNALVETKGFNAGVGRHFLVRVSLVSGQNLILSFSDATVMQSWSMALQAQAGCQ
ncbi:hypothetical protein HK100_003293 [Physocladia obscura]|uniref:Uncharacterized protein n=1 Tax=Physocladia obscura TaxID=109957 RepID=A0AAD5XG05_9FUNG|nr:hypothetical protein HK100_003293 [Physocladia obscura]